MPTKWAYNIPKEIMTLELPLLAKFLEKHGITSIGQIQVGYADTVAKNVERLKYDVQYLKSYSLFDDISLIFKTVQVMVLGRGQ